MQFRQTRDEHGLAADYAAEMSESCGLNGAQVSKAPWTPEEDVVLIQLVEKIGAQKWTIIAEYLP